MGRCRMCRCRMGRHPCAIGRERLEGARDAFADFDQMRAEGQADARCAPGLEVGVKRLKTALHAKVEGIRPWLELDHRQGIVAQHRKPGRGDRSRSLARGQPAIDRFHVGAALKGVELVGEHVGDRHAVVAHDGHAADREVGADMKAQVCGHAPALQRDLAGVVQSDTGRHFDRLLGQRRHFADGSGQIDDLR